jgi:hypothetical protein
MPLPVTSTVPPGVRRCPPGPGPPCHTTAFRPARVAERNAAGPRRTAHHRFHTADRSYVLPHAMYSIAHALRYKHSTIHNAYVKNGSRAPLPNGREPTPGKCKVGNKISGIRARWRCKPRPRRRVRLTLVLRPPNHGMRPEAPRSSFRSSGRELSMCNRRVVARELSM